MKKVISNIIIRRAEPRDIPKIEVLLSEICALHQQERPDIFKLGKKYEAEELSAMLLKPDHLILVADTGKEILGYTICLIKKRKKHPVLCDLSELYIDDLCIDADYRGQGVGHKLFEEIKRYAGRIGAHNITLNVWNFNKGAIKFYQSLGMRPARMTMELLLDD